MLKRRTALGVDISEGRINLALVARNGDGVRLLKADSGPVPDGAIKDGNVTDPTALARAIKKLKARNLIRSPRAAFSLVARPTLTQILDLREEVRGNVRQFVRDEVKHYAVLPINKTALDFCGIRSSGKSGNRRVLVVATDSRKISDTATALSREGLNVEAIEPAWAAHVRACYSKTIAGRSDKNVLIAMVRDGALTLSLFRNETVDFVRTKPIEPDASQSDEYVGWLAKEIEAVMKFYELKVSNGQNNWRINLVTDVISESLSTMTESLRTKLGIAELEVEAPEYTDSDALAADDKHANKPSTVAIGLAMKLLNVPGSGLNINLLPPELIEAKSREKQTLVIANAAAIIILLIILSVGFLGTRMQKVSTGIARSRQTHVSRDTPGLLNEQVLLQGQIDDMSETLDLMNGSMSAASALRSTSGR